MAVQLLASRQKFIRSEGIKLHHPWTAWTLKLFRAFIVDLFGPFPQPERQSAWTLTISKGQQAKIPRLSFGDISKFRRELWLALLQIFLDMFVDPGGQGAWAMAVATGQWHIVQGHKVWRRAPGGGELQGSCRHQQCKRHQSPHGSDGSDGSTDQFFTVSAQLELTKKIPSKSRPKTQNVPKRHRELAALFFPLRDCRDNSTCLQIGHSMYGTPNIPWVAITFPIDSTGWATHHLALCCPPWLAEWLWELPGWPFRRSTPGQRIQQDFRWLQVLV